MSALAPTQGLRDRQRAAAMIAVAFAMFVMTMASNAPSPLYVIYQQRYGLSAVVLTGIFATYSGGVMIALVTLGHVSDQRGRRQLMLPAVALLGVSAALFAAAQGTAWLFVARAVQGLATGTLTGAATAALVELEPANDRQRASYINTTMFIVGAATGPLIFGVVAQYLPWPTVLPFLLEEGLVALAMAGMWFVPETVVPAAQFRWRLQRPSVPASLLGPFTVAGMAVAVSWGVGALFAALSSSINVTLLHVRSHALAGLVLFALYGPGGASQIGLRHWPARRSIVVGASALSVGISLVYGGLSASSVVVVLGGMVVVGAGSGIAFMGSLTLLNDVAPADRRAEVISAWNIVGYIALSVPVIGVGLLSGAIGLQAATGVFAAAVVALSVATVVAVVAIKGGGSAMHVSTTDPAVPAGPGSGLAAPRRRCPSW